MMRGLGGNRADLACRDNTGAKAKLNHNATAFSLDDL